MIGRTNTGGGGVGGVLTVTAPAGVTVSVSKDGKVKTKTSNTEGLAVFKGLKTGTWQLTITDGSQVSTKPVQITADYSTVIAFFMATISITYPAGSTCTCSDGVTTLSAPDTSGTWACIVPNLGTWTVSCTDGVDTTTHPVEITYDGQSENVVLSYWNGELYDAGNEFTSVTGGWIAEAVPMTSGGSAKALTITRNATNMVIAGNAGNGGIVRTKNPITIKSGQKIYLDANVTSVLGTVHDSWSDLYVWSRIGSAYTQNVVAYLCLEGKNTNSVLSLPVSAGQYYIGFGMYEPHTTITMRKMYFK